MALLVDGSVGESCITPEKNSRTTAKLDMYTNPREACGQCIQATKDCDITSRDPPVAPVSASERNGYIALNTLTSVLCFSALVEIRQGPAYRA